MKLSELNYDYPEELVAIEPRRPSRVLWIQDRDIQEVTVKDVLARIQPGDLLVINDTKVEPRRVFAKNSSGETVEVLFVHSEEPTLWQVLLPSRQLKADKKVFFQGEVVGTLERGGRPQFLRLSQPITTDFFFQYGDMPLPPYIQSARGERRSRGEDQNWYQTEWAKEVGSSAAPTASLHFSNNDLLELQSKGVHVERLTLHVGLGTYLPVTVEDLDEHVMHKEWVTISSELAEKLQNAKHVWALGTTVARSIESWAQGLLQKNDDSSFSGWTGLLIQEGYQWKKVDRLLTNFHQPQSTLLALVCGFAGKNRVFEVYKYAIHHGFKLFSYGDLSVWVK